MDVASRPQKPFRRRAGPDPAEAESQCLSRSLRKYGPKRSAGHGLEVTWRRCRTWGTFELGRFQTEGPGHAHREHGRALARCDHERGIDPDPRAGRGATGGYREAT